MRASKLWAAAAAAGVVCASGAAHAAHVGVYVDGAAPGYYAPAPYYYQPAPPPPPQYIQRGPDGQPMAAPGPDGAPPPSGQDGSPPYPTYPQGSAPPYPQNGSTPYPPPGETQPYAPDDGPPQNPANGAPPYQPGNPAPQGSEPRYPQDSAPPAATPRTGGSNWYFCDATKTYYPYVKDCSSGWRPVPAQPADQQQQPQ